jgi:hypothetical protein
MNWRTSSNVGVLERPPAGAIAVTFESVQKTGVAADPAPVAQGQSVIVDLWVPALVSFGVLLSLVWAGFLLWMCARLVMLISARLF